MGQLGDIVPDRHALIDLLTEIQSEYAAEYIERIKNFRLPDELDKVNREFFLFSEEKGFAYEKITCAGSESYHYIRSGMIKEVNHAGWSSSKKYGALPEYQQSMLLNFVNNSVLGIYRQWVEEGKQQSVEEIIELTNKLVLGGVKGFFK